MPTRNRQIALLSLGLNNRCSCLQALFAEAMAAQKKKKKGLIVFPLWLYFLSWKAPIRSAFSRSYHIAQPIRLVLALDTGSMPWRQKVGNTGSDWEPCYTDKHAFCHNSFFAIDRRTNKTVLGPPDNVEDGGAEELIVDGRRHVARLMEGWGYGAHGVAEVDAPQQEEELSWRTQSFSWNVCCCFLFLQEFIKASPLLPSDCERAHG